MFSILQKSQDAVNAEDLETLQNEIERCLVEVVTRKWDLERELQALNTASPDAEQASPALCTATTTSAQAGNGGKLRNSHRLNQIESSENSSDGFKNSLFAATDHLQSGSGSGTNSTEDSVSSESSLVSSLTGSTIIAPSIPDTGSQAQTGNLAHLSNAKRSHKGTSDRPSKRFRQDGSHTFLTTGVHTKRPPHSKHRSKIVPVIIRA